MRSRSDSSTADAVANPAGAAEIGRFAPTPSGSLHLGSLLTAVASYLHARASGGQWLVRIEDLDKPRCVPGATAAILRTLDYHGLWWDGSVIYQSGRSALYLAALDQLHCAGHTFACTCSRSQLHDAAVYPGVCRDRVVSRGLDAPHSIRLRVPAETCAFNDEILGRHVARLDKDVGDFIILRRDGIFAYQLAVVVDDAAQQITQVVRGADLFDNTPRQLLLFRLLGAVAPRYAHVPILADRLGHKLSKQTLASSVESHRPSDNLHLILALLGHEPPDILKHAEPRELLAWATLHWDLRRVPRGAVHPGFVCI